LKLKTHKPDMTPQRKTAYKQRDGGSMQAIWDTFEYLKAQGMDIGPAAEAELVERGNIKEKYKKR